MCVGEQLYHHGVESNVSRPLHECCMRSYKLGLNEAAIAAWGEVC